MMTYRRLIPLCLLLLLLLATCVQARDTSSLRTQVRQTGAQTAQVLNFRLGRTVDECPGANPLFACSGVLVRPVAAGNPATFWKLGAGAQQTFLLLRNDAPQVNPPGKVGFVFQDRFSAIAQDRPYTAKQADGGWEVAIDNWNDQAPAGVAIEAVYYDIADPKALLWAHNAQRAFFDVTGEWLPVLRFSRTEAGQVSFGFNQMEQLYYGYSVAARLNARYTATPPSCPGNPGEADNPSYYCSGLLTRGTAVGKFHAWNPSPSSDTGGSVSFTWLRKDYNTPQVVWPQGFVMAPMSTPAAYRLKLNCIYPFDGGTTGLSGMCVDRGVCNSAQEALATYRAGKLCAIQPDKEGFEASITIRQEIPGHAWNEWMIDTWPQNIGKQLPLEAFFHTSTSLYKGEGLRDSQIFQRDLLNTDSRYLPILDLNATAADGQVFTYSPQDQSVDWGADSQR